MSPLESVSPSSSASIRLHEDEKTNSFLHRLASLVANIYITFSELSQKERQEVVLTEKEVTFFTNKSCEALTSQSSVSAKASIAALVVFTVAFGCSFGNDRILVQKISDHIPTVANHLYGVEQQTTSKNYDALTTVKQTKLQDKSAKAQSEGNIKESFAQVLQAEINRLREAAPGKNG